MCKIAIVYTGVNSVLMNLIDSTIKEELSGLEYEIIMFADPTIITEVSKDSKVSTKAYKDLFDMYWGAAKSGADIIYNICSSVGEIADFSNDILEKCGVKLVKIDEDMGAFAVQNAAKIGVLATLNSTLNPTVSLLEKHAKSNNKKVTIKGLVIDGMFGKSAAESQSIMVDYAKQLGEVDIIVLAQASMADNAPAIESETGIKTISSPVFGAKKLRKAVEELS